MAEPPTPSRKVRADALDRAERAWRLRVAGGTWEQIAAHIGYSDGPTCQRAVRNVLGQTPAPEREDLRNLWRARLEALWSQTLKDATEQRAGATTSGVRVAQAAANLDGLNEPTRVDLNTPSTEEMQVWLAAVLASSSGLPREFDIVAGEVESGLVD